jgi:type VI secretion system protein ImpF
MNESARLVRRSVLDRLLQGGEGEPRTWQDSVRAHRAAVLRDLQWLLNTRRVIREAPDELPELQHSVYHYGLPDMTSLSADSPTARRQLLRRIESCIEQFEPRLSAVRVREAPADPEPGHRIQFVVEALLRLQPEPEPIAFDTVLDAASGRFRVSGGG